MSDDSFWGNEKIFSEGKIIFSSPQNKLSGVNKTYIGIGNGQTQNAKLKEVK
jgi:hypothetical protein